MLQKTSFMDTQKISFGWARFVVFEALCFFLCFIIASVFVKLGVFNEVFIKSGGLWKSTLFIFGLWFILSSAALIHHRWGMDSGLYITSLAVVASPCATLAFIAGFNGYESFPAVILLVIVSTLAGLVMAIGLIKIGEFLEDLMYPLFRRMDL